MLKRLLLLMLGLILVACGGEETGRLPTFTPNVTDVPTVIPATPRPTTIPATMIPLSTLPPEVNLSGDVLADPARVRVVQANPALEAVDIYIGGQIVGGRFRYGSQTSESVQVAPGEYEVNLVATGAPNSPQNRLLTLPLTLTPRQEALLVVMGDAEEVQMRVYPLNLTPVAAGQIRLTVIHAVPNGPPISVTANGQTVVDGIIYGNTQANIDLSMGDYTFSFHAEEESLLVEDVTLSAGETYVMLLVGGNSDGQFDTQIFHETTNARASVRVINGSFGSAPVRVLLDEQLVVENLGYEQYTDRFISLEMGDYTLKVEAMSAQPNDPPLLEVPLQLDANSQSELFLYDRPESLKAALYPVVYEPVTNGEARLTLINGIIGQPKLRAVVNNQLADSRLALLGSDGAETSVPQLEMPFGMASAPAVIRTGVQTFSIERVNEDGSSDILFETPELTIEEGQAYTYVLLGRNGVDSVLLAAEIALLSDEEVLNNVASDSEETSVRFANALLSQAPFTVSINDEVVAQSIPYGQISQAQAINPNEALTVKIENSTGQVLLETPYVVLEGIESTLLIVGEGEGVRYIAAESRPLLRRQGAALGTFVNAITQQDSLLSMIYYPSQNTLPDAVDAPIASPTPDESQFQYVGNTFSFGQFATLEMTPREYELQVRDDTNGQVLGRFYLTPERDTDYFYVVMEQAGEVELLTITAQ